MYTESVNYAIIFQWEEQRANNLNNFDGNGYNCEQVARLQEHDHEVLFSLYTKGNNLSLTFSISNWASDLV